MDDIIVLDDFLPQYIQDFLEKGFYNSLNFIATDKTIPEVSDDPLYKGFDGEQFVGWIKWKDQVHPLNLAHYYLLPIQIASLKLGQLINYESLYRAKINITLNTSNEENKIAPPHQDSKDTNPTIIGIYYVIDSDGDTIIYDGDHINNLKEIKRISPKKGRMVFFRGDRFHSASHPSKHGKRVVINYNVNH